jgi:hypothetical protein
VTDDGLLNDSFDRGVPDVKAVSEVGRLPKKCRESIKVGECQSGGSNGDEAGSPHNHSSGNSTPTRNENNDTNDRRGKEGEDCRC